jgi:predicted nucleic acid-binding protein
VSFLLDTNIVSELRRGARTPLPLLDWFEDQPADTLFLSALTLGEIREGIERARKSDARWAALLDRWLYGLTSYYEERILYVDGAICEDWGRMRATKTVPVIDGLLAATARVHDLTMVTRNTRDFTGLGVRVLNPLA